MDQGQVRAEGICEAFAGVSSLPDPPKEQSPFGVLICHRHASAVECPQDAPSQENRSHWRPSSPRNRYVCAIAIAIAM